MKTVLQKNNTDIDLLLNTLAADFFDAMKLDATQKKKIFGDIQKAIQENKQQLQKCVVAEVKLTQKDAEKEVNRAYRTFCIAEEHADFTFESEIENVNKKITEKRLPRGPLFAITPFSSPLSSPAHKIASGLLAGTSILFKPAQSAQKTGKLLFDIISQATQGKYVFFCSYHKQKDLQQIVSDERIGIISFTGGYETGKKIIQIGGVKKYHMELAGGNAPVFFAPDYNRYEKDLLEKLVDGIVAKNGQRCVSIKHIFISERHRSFVVQLQERLLLMKQEIQSNFAEKKEKILGPLITEKYAAMTEKKVVSILELLTSYESCIPFEREKDYIFPTMYEVPHIQTKKIREILNYEIPGPVVFVHFYQNEEEYAQLITALKNDYIYAGLQVSLFTTKPPAIKEFTTNLLWGGIIINDIPTFRDEYMSFGGFGRSGLGKEGFFETVQAYTDPQVIVNSFI